MTTEIKCPKCGNSFEPSDAIRDEVEKELRSQMTDWKKKQSEEFQLKLADERKRMQVSLEEDLQKRLAGEFENKLRILEQNNKHNEEKLKEAREKELRFMELERELKNREAELEITTKRKMQEERVQISEEIRKIEQQKNEARETEYQLRTRELEKQLEDQKKLAEEMRRKSEQGSMQLQGEAQELALEEMLRSAFPFDVITDVGKGVRGADCIQSIHNTFGQECGKIIYESKRTNAFTAEWIEKLKRDMRSMGADVAVIVTRSMPREMDCFGIRDGVWVCSFSEVRALAAVLRDGVIRVFAAAKSNENKGDKMQFLYTYLTSNEFAEQWKAIREGFMSMKMSIQKERDAMEKMWKAREKQLEKVLLNAAHIRGSIEGISGTDVDLNLLTAGDGDPE
jgi:hypothetical protein